MAMVAKHTTEADDRSADAVNAFPLGAIDRRVATADGWDARTELEHAALERVLCCSIFGNLALSETKRTDGGSVAHRGWHTLANHVHPFYARLACRMYRSSLISTI